MQLTAAVWISLISLLRKDVQNSSHWIDLGEGWSLKAHSHVVRLTRAGAAEVYIAAQIERVLILCTAPVCRTRMCQTHIVWMSL